MRRRKISSPKVHSLIKRARDVPPNVLHCVMSTCKNKRLLWILQNLTFQLQQD